MSMWLLLITLTLLVMLLPMVPAIAEWRWPKDVAPLHIDTQDALDPPFLARTFAARLADALERGQASIGDTPIATVPPRGGWVFDETELREQTSRRVWHAAGDSDLAARMSFLAEVAVRGNLRTAPGGVYRALWVEQTLTLAPMSTLLRWAHGLQVDAAHGCRLAGRVSADKSVHLGPHCRFALLHAPVIQFVASEAHTPAQTAARLSTLPAHITWNAASREISGASMNLGNDREWHGDLVCKGELTLGRDCDVDGSLKAYGGIEIAADSIIRGNLVAQDDILLHDRCIVLGSIISETAIVLGADCIVGAPGRPATVSAPQIVVAPGVVVHGTVWAGESGTTLDHDAARNAALETDGVLRQTQNAPLTPRVSDA